LLNDSTYADLQIRCNGRVFKVHKVVVCTQVKFFAACMKWEFQESKSGIIFLEDDTPEILELLIQFLYTGDYTVEIPEARDNQRVYHSNAELLVHAQIHTHADKYLLDELRALSISKFERALRNLAPVLFTEVFSTIMKGCPEKNEIFQTMCVDFAALHNKTLLTFRDYRNFCAENGAVCVRIMKVIADKVQDIKCSRCGVDIPGGPDGSRVYECRPCARITRFGNGNQ
ncbi:hypothetical protein HYFRA_00006807, partial [Hymenoscyphus fraxineus]